jgi:hypothetical protein
MSTFRVTKKLAKHLLIYFLIIGVIMAISALLYVYGPPRIKYYDDSWDSSIPYVPETNITYNILLDQHSHTRYSDGKVSLRQNIEWHIAMGFTAIVITDHNTLGDVQEFEVLAEEYKNEIILIQGMEWTTRRVHLNLIGISEWELKIPRNPSDSEIIETINEVHRQNGTVTVNHLPLTEKITGSDMPSREQLDSWGVDFFEVMNRNIFDDTSYQYILDNNGSVGAITGTDMHSPDSYDGGRVHAWTALNVSSFTHDSVMEQLRAHNTSFIIYGRGVENFGIYKKSIVYEVLYPFYKLGESLVNYQYRFDTVFGAYDRVVFSVFISYTFSIFFITDAFLLIRSKIKLRKKIKT